MNNTFEGRQGHHASFSASSLASSAFISLLLFCSFKLCNPVVYTPLSCPSSVGMLCDKGTKCVSNYMTCNNFTSPACTDKSDVNKKMCLTFQCPEGRHKCSDKLQCIDDSAACDGNYDCTDKSDELPVKCKAYNCTNDDRIFCPSGVGCLPDNSTFCDGVKDCVDGSDEASAFCLSYICPNGTWECANNRQCINNMTLCDGVKDCTDGSDEAAATCSSYNCTVAGKVNCPLKYPMCIDDTLLCDGIKDCGTQGTDESAAYCNQFTCPFAYSKCADNIQCLSLFDFCDDNVDCNDKSDESAKVCSTFKCLTPKSSCPSLVGCVDSKYALCDGVKDCADDSDETVKLCSTYTCLAGTVKCSDGNQCVPKYKMCDGVKDCKDGSDELPANCSTYACSNQGKVNCPLGYPQCIQDSSLCNGRDDCVGNATDESPLFCTTFKCLPGDSKCKNNLQCLKSDQFCNGGSAQCNDKSDEDSNFCATYKCKATGRVNCPLKSPMCLPTADGICDGIPNDCPKNTDESAVVCKKYACKDTTFTKCADGLQCILKSQMCNGIIDCNDGSDEDATNTCKNYVCNDPTGANWGGDQRVSCPLNTPQCLSSAQRICDGRRDCYNGADEDSTFCKTYQCPAGSSKCADNICLSSSLFCDGVRDCPDGSDESTVICSTFNCSASGRVNCPNGANRCVYGETAFCNGKTYECPGNSDEDPTFCQSIKCDASTEFKCTSGPCLPLTSVCDGIKDCPDGSDENRTMCFAFNCATADPDTVSCPGTIPNCVAKSLLCDGNSGNCPGSPKSADEDPTFCKTYSCLSGYQKCSDGLQCLPYSLFCDNATDCNDLSDEGAFCKTYKCSNTPGMVNCPNSQPLCVPSDFICDGVPHCPSASDEDSKYCSSYSCLSNQIKCPGNNTLCVFGAFCDGKRDCMALTKDGSTTVDEDPKICKSYKCSQGYVKCKNSLQCIPQASMCDGKFDCNDFSDENAKTCASYKCASSGRISCPSGSYCLSSSCKVCDGLVDCPDGSDELTKNCKLRKKTCGTAVYNS